jgi:hypothetical protein
MCVGRDGLTLSDYNVGLRLLIARKYRFRAFPLRQLVKSKTKTLQSPHYPVPTVSACVCVAPSARFSRPHIEVQALAQILTANKCWQHPAGEIRSLKERKGIGRALTQEDESLLRPRRKDTSHEGAYNGLLRFVRIGD